MKIVNNLRKVCDAISVAEQRFKRANGSVCLLAVSKTRTIAEIQAISAKGQCHFGENYCQEAIFKIKNINNPQLVWHFIGPIQSNKTKQIAEHFDWVHTIDRIKIVRRLNESRPASKPPLNICIQVNISKEPSKSGIIIDECDDFIKALAAFKKIRLRGLMTLPAPVPHIADRFNLQRIPFAKLREQFNRSCITYPYLDTLSMGTSQDMVAAIAEGATIIRVGSAIFGPRSGRTV